MLNLALKMFGSRNERVLRRFQKRVDQINALGDAYREMSDRELQGQTAIFRQRLANGETLDQILPETFAVAREAAHRALGERHYDVQLIGGMVLHEGRISEMKTGEGKTLVATLPVYLNALTGKGVHVVTVNDYLARRDAAWMAPVYNFLGLSVGVITSDMRDADRKASYAADITYGTNNELGFDYLRDNMKYHLDQMVQRPFNFAIVDEVDSILIDEARTPLIISGPSESHSDLYVKVDKIIPRLEAADFELDEKMKTVVLTERGTESAENLLREAGLLQDGGMYDAGNIALVHHVNQALRAHKLFQRDTEYIVKDDKVIIIDEFTGRMMEGRRFSEGLHQALEAKEGVQIQNENQTLASITFQNYFRLYPKLAGMTGTAMTEATEFADIYNLDVVEIPTHKAVQRLDHDDKIYKTQREKEEAILALIKECGERKQPVLVGTTSIEKSENLSALLKRNGVAHQVLNARYHEQEAYIIAQAGHPGAVTIATNMAGRGTDIKLGGNIEMRIRQEVDESWPEDRKKAAADAIKAEIEKNREIVRQAGGLYIIGTERHESRRIDNQLRGRSGRQGDLGASMFFLSLDDDLMRIFGSEKMEVLLAHKHIGLREGEALTHPWISKALERAQAKVESMNYDIRKNLLKFDNVMNDQRKVIYEQRREIMQAETVDDLVREMRHGVIEDLVTRCIPERSYADQWDTATLKIEVHRILGLELPVDEWAKEEGIADQEILQRIVDASDSKMSAKAANAGTDAYRRLEKALLLQKLDQHWKEHLLNLDHLRQGINLRAFGQRDPLNEYKAEAFAMFEMMLDHLRESVTLTLSLIEFSVDADAANVLLRRAATEQKVRETRQDPALMGMGLGQAQEQGRRNMQRAMAEARPLKTPEPDSNDPATWTALPRNAPCPCGSGKKYKHCHGRVVE